MLRGLRTFFVRRDAQCRGAQRIAEFSCAAGGGTRVVSGLADDPGHDRARRVRWRISAAS